ncbi:M20/M25/M40 family metallo-hydrolase [Halobaculum sp. D14]|uniref:M20/M25/M40 family metallo-hydrolase n=1 Tax=Halobaculum sp. D14 TaxID=3421642 RepID=UPI003EBCB8B2
MHTATPPYDLRTFAERLCGFASTAGDEAAAADWLAGRFDDFGFDVYEWEADPALLADHPSFPDDPADIDAAGRPSVAGVAEFGDPDAGPTLVLNGHVDVVPADPELWETDPYDPVWRRDGADETLTARGAADMKAGLAACVYAALDLRAAADDGAADADLNGRVVVEAVAGEEDGGIGAAASTLDSPYPFDRDAVVVAEPTDLTPVTATEGSVMMRLRLRGRSAHAATRWRGVDVLPKFEAVRAAFADLESERAAAVTHPLYESFPVPWPVVCGTVRAGSWASTVPGTLESEWRLGVAPGETVAEVEAAFERRLAEVVAADDWLADHPPTFERFSVQFEPAEIDAGEPVVEALRGAMADADVPDRGVAGATYGADSRHYVAAGVPAVLFGPGTIDQAHFPDESVPWRDVERARRVYAATARRFLADAAGYDEFRGDDSGDRSSVEK